MENNQTQWSEVKKIKFHHRVKRFYHKNLFRKIYTVAIIGLVAANIFSIVKYASFADTGAVLQENTAKDEVVVTMGPVDGSESQISPTPLCQEGQNCQDASSLIKEGDHEVVEDLDSSASVSEGQTGSEGGREVSQNDEGNAQEPHPTPLLIGEGSPDKIGTGEVDSDTQIDSSLETQNDEIQLELRAIAKSQELQNARKTLNTSPINGSSMHNNLRVSVNAPAGSFPQGTKLVIKPIDKGNAESVAFDISFIYTYSDGSTVELQPLKGKNVQVVFNYEENALWRNALNQGQELKVKHTHDGETQEVDYSNSEEGNLTIDTDKFSKYEFSLVKGTDMQTLSTDERNTATYSSGSEGYTVTYNGVSYTLALSDLDGYYYWGWDEPSYDNDFNPIDGKNNFDLNNTNGVNNAWGGGSDTASNGYNPTPTNYDERKGPCDDGWHVPSRGEWNAILIAWCHDTNNSCTESDLQHADDWTVNNNLIYIKNSTLATEFKRDFGMTNNYIWSSSPYPSNDHNARYVNVYNNGIYPRNYTDRNYYYRVRCVKNSSYTPPTFSLTFHADQGTIDPSSKTVDQGSTITAPSWTNANASGVTWYTEATFENEFDFSDPVNADYDIYAKWTCKDGYVTNDNGKTCEVELGIVHGTITYHAEISGDNSTMNSFDFKTITVGDYVIMDRNLGATEPWTYDDEWSSTKYSTPIASYGYYYQWGNNFGFSPITDTVGVSSVVTVPDEYIPSKYSSGAWSSVGGRSTQSNLWGDGFTTDAAKQGPCPKGWHVPSRAEWNAIYTAWTNVVHTESKSGVGKNFAYDLLLPPVGGRRNTDLAYTNVGGGGRYWASTPHDGTNGNTLNVDVSNVDPNNNSTRAYAHPVRCMKSEPTPPTISFTDGVSDTYARFDTIIVNWGEATVTKYMFTTDTECSTNSEDYTATSDTNFNQTTETNNGKYLCLYAENENGISTTLKSENTVHIDVTSPTGTIQINSGVTYASGANVTLTTNAVDTGAGMGKMKFSCNGVAWSNFENYTTSKSWDLNNGNGCTAGDGEKTVYVRYQDLAGNIKEITGTIILDTTGPEGSILIDNGAEYTNDSNRHISMTLSATDTYTSQPQFRISCNANNWTNWNKYRTSDGWTFGSSYGCTPSDGEKTIYVQYKDNAGNISQYSDTIILDTTGPIGSITLAGGAEYTANPKVSLALSASDALTGVGHFRISCNANNWTNWNGYKTSDNWTFGSSYGCTPSDGTKTLYVQYKDKLGNESDVFSGTIILDTTGPEGGIIINNGDLYTNSRTVSLTLDASDGAGVRDMVFSCDGIYWSGRQTYNSNYEWTFTDDSIGCTAADGLKTLYVSYRDNLYNNRNSEYSGTITLDTVSPTCEITLNPTSPTNQNVELTVNYLVETNQISEGYSWNGEDYTSTQTITVTQNGTYIGYVKDAAGNTGSCSVTVNNIDTTAPTGTIQINGGATYASGANVTLTTNAVDTGAGMGKMKFSCNGSDWSELENYTTTKSWNLNTGSGCTAGDGTKTVYVYYQDNVTNSYITSDTIILDREAPTGSILINNGAEYTNSTATTHQVTLTLIANDVYASQLQYRVTCNPNDSNAWTNWHDYSSTTDYWTFGNSNGCNSNDGIKTLYIEYKDNAGNISQTSADSITLDRVNPTCEITGNPASSTNQDVELTLSYLVEANQISEGYSWNGEDYTSTQTTTVTANGTYTGYVKDAAGNTGSCSVTVTKIDKTAPVASIDSTDTLKSDSQTATLSCTDSVGVSKYYRGTKSNPTDEDYTAVSSTTEFSTSKPVAAAETYYLLCKDSAGNVSNVASKTYYTYAVHNMLNAIDKSEGTYNSTNYPQSSAATYIAPAGTTITFASVYSLPEYSAADQYKGYTLSSDGEPSNVETATLNSDSTYYLWFDRTKYDLTMVVNTGIDTIHYKVNGADSYSSVSSSTVVPMKAGSNAYVYATAHIGYDYDATSQSNPKVWENVTSGALFAPTTELNVYTVVWKNRDGDILETDNVQHGTLPTYDGSIPTKASDDSYTYSFSGWNPAVSEVVGDTEYVAQFNATQIDKGSNYSGGGGKRSSNKDTHGSATDPSNTDNSETSPKDSEKSEPDTSKQDANYSLEQRQAYQFAKANGITTQSNINNANMNGKLTRIQMAKMLSYYAMNVLGQTPDVSQGIPKFSDISNELNTKYDNGVTLAYQLGIMGINMGNRFMPNSYVTRAEFTTALSRMLYGLEDGTGKTKYYEPHMNKLKEEGVITNINPKLKELRGYVMIMLMRSAE